MVGLPAHQPTQGRKVSEIVNAIIEMHSSRMQVVLTKRKLDHMQQQEAQKAKEKQSGKSQSIRKNKNSTRKKNISARPEITSSMNGNAFS